MDARAQNLCVMEIASEFGSAGHRSLYLSHAKRPLYHLSYTPGKSLGASHAHTLFGSPRVHEDEKRIHK